MKDTCCKCGIVIKVTPKEWAKNKRYEIIENAPPIGYLCSDCRKEISKKKK